MHNFAEEFEFLSPDLQKFKFHQSNSNSWVLLIRPLFFFILHIGLVFAEISRISGIVAKKHNRIVRMCHSNTYRQQNSVDM